MKVAAVIVAAGRGLRAGGTLPKQWQRIADATVAEHTLRAFRSHSKIGDIVLVLHADDLDRTDWSRDDDTTAVPGGDTRAASVRAGLEALAEDVTHVLVHDVARPLVDHATIDRVLTALETCDAAAPAIPVIDALWLGENGKVLASKDRSNLFRAQTPQGFNAARLRAAHATGDAGAADDVEIARKAGIDVTIVEGHVDNFKITTPNDFARAERILQERQSKTMDIRVGNGFDVHRFGPGDAVILCGISVPHDRALQGHSDADVALHTVTDAIYGALSEGDIGRHFPPSEPQWKGVDSEVFLAHAVQLATSRGYRISNADCTIICEFPKIGPHAARMQNNLARILGIDTNRVSVKATTSEKLGFTGRGEGIACMATVTLVAP